MSISSHRIVLFPALTAGLLSLAACAEQNEQSAALDTPQEDAQAAEDAPAEEQVSIIRPDVEIDRNPATLQPLELRVGFEENGSALSDQAREALASILASPQMEAGGPVVLRGHTDSSGSDAANLRASQRRAEAVRDWLVENGVAADRIEVIAMGEQNPARPNARPDGTPDEDARAFNRRVDVTIGVPEALAAPADQQEPQTLVESLAKED
jgi:OOP family OmpA-OmpF porin